MKYLNLILYFTIIITIGIIILIGFWLNYPYKPIVFKDSYFKVLTPVVKSGDIVQFEVDCCKYTKLGAKMSRTFIDGITFTTPEVDVNRAIGCSKSIVGVTVPTTLPEGRYYIKTVYRYQVNPIRNVDVVTVTEKFNVIK